MTKHKHRAILYPNHGIVKAGSGGPSESGKSSGRLLPAEICSGNECNSLSIVFKMIILNPMLSEILWITQEDRPSQSSSHNSVAEEVTAQPLT